METILEICVFLIRNSGSDGEWCRYYFHISVSEDGLKNAVSLQVQMHERHTDFYRNDQLGGTLTVTAFS
jgi:hypothetical protein